jgi:hypothetical protein
MPDKQVMEKVWLIHARCTVVSVFVKYTSTRLAALEKTYRESRRSVAVFSSWRPGFDFTAVCLKFGMTLDQASVINRGCPLSVFTQPVPHRGSPLSVFTQPVPHRGCPLSVFTQPVPHRGSPLSVFTQPVPHRGSALSVFTQPVPHRDSPLSVFTQPVPHPR